MSQVSIPPVVGRIVWFYAAANSAEAGFAPPSAGKPLAAIIARVWSDTCVNLTVFDADGAPHSRTSVLLVQDGQPVPDGYYCEWMPFQKGQARAQERVQSALAGTGVVAALAKSSCDALASGAQAPVRASQVVDAKWANAVDRIDAALPSPSRRDRSEAELVAGAARVLAEDPSSAKKLAEGVKEFLDTLYPAAMPTPDAHIRNVLYGAIGKAMEELAALHPGFNDHVNLAWNHLHRAFWSECPAPASAPGLRAPLTSDDSTVRTSEPAATGFASSHFDFTEAIRYLKAGQRLARAGWNGKGMFVYHVPAASYPVQTGAAKAHFGEGAMVPYNAYFALKGVDGAVSTWVPSVNDCLAEDWLVVGA